MSMDEINRRLPAKVGFQIKLAPTEKMSKQICIKGLLIK
jgi:hypothetical protein